MSISVPDGTPEELIETTQAVAGYITSSGGEILRSSNESPWGRRRLAYPIRHHSADLRDGFYTLYHFQSRPEAIREIEREILLNDRIIRYLLLQLDTEPIFAEETDEPTDGDGESATDTEGTTTEEPAEQPAAATTEPDAAPEVAATEES